MEKSEIDIDKNKILELENEIYPVCQGSKTCDEEVEKLYTIKNWAEMFYHAKTKIIKDRFLKLISLSEYSKFFEGLDYEYGLNDKTIDIQKAFQIYKEKADNSTDTLSMYKMYHIYKNEYKKFGFSHRNKILEKFYLFKSFSYLSRHSIEGYCHLLNRFNVAFEVKVNVFYEDKKLEKFNKLIKHLKEYSNYYKINSNDLIIIESMMLFEFKNCIEAKTKAMDLIQDLIDKNNLEAIYRKAIYLFKDNFKSDEYFKILEETNYYRSFCDYAIYLFQKKNDYKKALELLKKAISNGELRANYLYYDIFLFSFDFSKIEINTDIKENLLYIFNLLINDIVSDGIYSYFEFFYLRKILIKHWDLKYIIDSNFMSFATDFANILVGNTSPSPSEEEIKQKKDLIKNIYQRDDYFSEFHLSCGLLYFYGLENIIDIDLKKSLFKFQISYDVSDSKSYKRFCYSYISRIKQKLNELDNNLISNSENEEAKKILFDLYKTSIKREHLDILSSSFYYFLSRLYGRKWGNSGNEIMEFICLKKASDNCTKTPGTGSSICHYRRYKSKIKLIKNSQKYIEMFKEIEKKEDSEGYGEDNSLCPICFENKRNIMILPCKHLICNFCIKKIMEKGDCPLCRCCILFYFDFDKIHKKNEEKEQKEQKKENEETNI